jgi:hypothetical protein
MKTKIYLVFFLVFFTLQIAAAKPPEADTVKRDHLIVKLNLLWSVVYIGSSNDGYLLSLPFEYKTKSPIALQFTTTYDHGLIVDEGDETLEFTLEGRYYFKYHFTGIYGRFETFHIQRYLHSDKWARWREQYAAFGVFYGYQREFNRLIIEGQAGVGITFNLNDSERSLNYPYPKVSSEPFIDILLAIYLGWRIF